RGSRQFRGPHSTPVRIPQVETKARQEKFGWDKKNFQVLSTAPRSPGYSWRRAGLVNTPRVSGERCGRASAGGLPGGRSTWRLRCSASSASKSRLGRSRWNRFPAGIGRERMAGMIGKSLVAEGDHWVYASGSTGREPGGQDHCEQQKYGHGAERHGVDRAYLKQQRLNQTRQGRGSKDPNDDGSQGCEDGLLEDHPHDFAGRGTQGGANSDFTCALRGRVGLPAVNARHRQQKRSGPENSTARQATPPA